MVKCSMVVNFLFSKSIYSYLCNVFYVHNCFVTGDNTILFFRYTSPRAQGAMKISGAMMIRSYLNTFSQMSSLKNSKHEEKVFLPTSSEITPSLSRYQIPVFSDSSSLNKRVVAFEKSSFLPFNRSSSSMFSVKDSQGLRILKSEPSIRIVMEKDEGLKDHRIEKSFKLRSATSSPSFSSVFSPPQSPLEVHHFLITAIVSFAIK